MANPLAMRPQGGALPLPAEGQEPPKLIAPNVQPAGTVEIEGMKEHEEALKAYQSKDPDLDFRPDVGLVHKKGYELPGGKTAIMQMATGRVWLEPSEHGDIAEQGLGAMVRKHGAGWYDPDKPDKPAPDGSVIPGGARLGFDGKGRPAMKRLADGAWWSSPGTTGGAMGWFQYGKNGESAVAENIPGGVKRAMRSMKKTAVESVKKVGQAVSSLGELGNTAASTAQTVAAPVLGLAALGEVPRVEALEKLFQGKDFFDAFDVQDKFDNALKIQRAARVGMHGAGPMIQPNQDAKAFDITKSPLAKVIRDGKISKKDLDAYFASQKEGLAEFASGNIRGAVEDDETRMRRHLYVKTAEELDGLLANKIRTVLEAKGVNAPQGAGVDALDGLVLEAMQAGLMTPDEVKNLSGSPEVKAKVGEIQSLKNSMDPTAAERAFAEYQKSSGAWLGGHIGSILQLVPFMRAAAPITAGAKKALRVALKKGVKAGVKKAPTMLGNRVASNLALRMAGAAPGMIESAAHMGALQAANQLPAAAVRQAAGEEGAIRNTAGEIASHLPVDAMFGTKTGKVTGRFMRPGIPQAIAQTALRTGALGAVGALNDTIMHGAPLTLENAGQHMLSLAPIEFGMNLAHGRFSPKKLRAQRAVLDDLAKRRQENPDVQGMTGEQRLEGALKSMAEQADAIEFYTKQAAEAPTPEGKAFAEAELAKHKETHMRLAIEAEATQAMMHSGQMDDLTPRISGAKVGGVRPSVEKAMRKAAEPKIKDAAPAEGAPVAPVAASPAPVAKPAAPVDAEPAPVGPSLGGVPAPAKKTAQTPMRQAAAPAAPIEPQPKARVTPDLVSLEAKARGTATDSEVAQAKNMLQVTEAALINGNTDGMDGMDTRQLVAGIQKAGKFWEIPKRTAKYIADRVEREAKAKPVEPVAQKPEPIQPEVKSVEPEAKVAEPVDLPPAEPVAAPAPIAPERVDVRPGESNTAASRRALKEGKLKRPEPVADDEFPDPGVTELMVKLREDYGEDSIGSAARALRQIAGTPNQSKMSINEGDLPDGTFDVVSRTFEGTPGVEIVEKRKTLRDGSTRLVRSIQFEYEPPVAPDPRNPLEGGTILGQELYRHKKSVENGDGKVPDPFHNNERAWFKQRLLETAERLEKASSKKAVEQPAQSATSRADKAHGEQVKLVPEERDGEKTGRLVPEGYRFTDPHEIGRGLVIPDADLINLLAAEGHPSVKRYGFGVVEEMAKRLEKKAEAIETKKTPDAKRQATFFWAEAAKLRDDFDVPDGYTSKNDYSGRSDAELKAEVERLGAARKRDASNPQGILDSLVSDKPFKTKNFEWIKSEIPGSAKDGVPNYRMVPVPLQEDGHVVETRKVKSQGGGGQVFEVPDIRYDQKVHLAKIGDVLEEHFNQTKTRHTRSRFSEDIARKHAALLADHKGRYIGKDARQAVIDHIMANGKLDPAQLGDIYKKQREQAGDERPGPEVKNPQEVTLDAEESASVLRNLRELYEKQSDADISRRMQEAEDAAEFQKQMIERGRGGSAMTADQFFRDKRRGDIERNHMDDPNWTPSDTKREANDMFLKGGTARSLIGEGGEQLVDRVMSSGLLIGGGPLAEARKTKLNPRERGDLDVDGFRDLLKKTKFTLSDGREVYGNQLENTPEGAWLKELRSIRERDIQNIMHVGQMPEFVDSTQRGDGTRMATDRDVVTARRLGFDLTEHTGFVGSDNSGGGERLGEGYSATNDSARDGYYSDRRQRYAQMRKTLAAPHVFDQLFDLGVVRPADIKPDYDYWRDAQRAFGRGLDADYTVTRTEDGREVKTPGPLSKMFQGAYDKAMRELMSEKEIGSMKGRLPQLAEKLAIREAAESVRDQIIKAREREGFLGSPEERRLSEALKGEAGQHFKKAVEEAGKLSPEERMILAMAERTGQKLGEDFRLGDGWTFDTQMQQALLDTRHPDHMSRVIEAQKIVGRSGGDEFADMAGLAASKLDSLGMEVPEEMAKPAIHAGEQYGMTGNERVRDTQRAYRQAVAEEGGMQGVISEARRQIEVEINGPASTVDVVNRGMEMLRKRMGLADGEQMLLLGAKRDAVLRAWRENDATKHLVEEYQSKLDKTLDAVDKIVDPTSWREQITATISENRDVLDLIEKTPSLQGMLKNKNINESEVFKVFGRELMRKLKAGEIDKGQADAMAKDFRDGVAGLAEAFEAQRTLAGAQETVRHFLRNLDPRILNQLNIERGEGGGNEFFKQLGGYNGVKDVVSLSQTVGEYVSELLGRDVKKRGGAMLDPRNLVRRDLKLEGRGYRDAALAATHEIIHFVDTYLDRGFSDRFRETFFDARREWLNEPGNEVLKELYRVGGSSMSLDGMASLPESGAHWSNLKGMLEQKGDKFYTERDGQQIKVAEVKDGRVTLFAPTTEEAYQWRSPGEFFAVVGSQLLDKSVDIGRLKRGLNMDGARSNLMANLLDLTEMASGIVSASTPEQKGAKPGTKIRSNLDVLRGAKSGDRAMGLNDVVRTMLVDMIGESRMFDPAKRNFAITGKNERVYAGMTALERATKLKLKTGTVDYSSPTSIARLKQMDEEAQRGGQPLPFGEPFSVEEALLGGVKDSLMDRLAGAREYGKAALKLAKEGSTIEDIKGDFKHFRDEGLLKASAKALFGQINAKLVAGTGHMVNRTMVEYGARAAGESTMDAMAVAKMPIYGDRKFDTDTVNHMQRIHEMFRLDMTDIGMKSALKAAKAADDAALRQSKTGKFEKAHEVTIKDPHGRDMKWFVNSERTIAISEHAAEAHQFLEQRGRGEYKLLSPQEQSALKEVGEVIDKRNEAFYEELRNNPYVDQDALSAMLDSYGPDGKRWIPRLYGNERSEFSGYTFGIDDALADIHIGGSKRLNSRVFPSVMDAIKAGYIPQHVNPIAAWLEGRRQQRTLVGFNEAFRKMAEAGHATFATQGLVDMAGKNRWVRIDAPVRGRAAELFGWSTDKAWMSEYERNNYSQLVKEWSIGKKVAEEAGGTSKDIPEFPLNPGFYIHRDAYPMFRAFFGQGLAGHKFYRRVMHLNGTLNAFQLFGPFHGTVAGGFFTGAWRIGSGVAQLASMGSRAMKQAIGESLNEAMNSTYASYRASGLTKEQAKARMHGAWQFAQQVAGNESRGHALQNLMLRHFDKSREAILSEPSLNDAEKAILMLAQTSGMSPMRAVMMEQQAKFNLIKTLGEVAWKEPGMADVFRRAGRFVQAAGFFAENGIQHAQSHIMGGIVARNKLGTFLKEAGHLINSTYDTSKPGWINELVRDLDRDTFITRNSNRLADRLDDVFGMANWKKLGMNPKFKGVLQMVERAYAWHHGTNRSVLSALTELSEATPGIGKVVRNAKRKAGIYGLDDNSPLYAVRFGLGHLAASAIVNTLLIASGIAGMATDSEDDWLDTIRKIGFVTIGGDEHDKDSANPYFASVGYWDEGSKLFYDPKGWMHQVVLGGKSPLLSMGMNAAKNLFYPDEFQRNGFTTKTALNWTPTDEDTRKGIVDFVKEQGDEGLGLLAAKRVARTVVNAAGELKPMSLGAMDSASSPLQKAAVISGLRKADRRTRRKLGNLPEETE